MDDQASISDVARRNGAVLDLLYRWRRLMLAGRQCRGVRR
ncbi:transposase [Nitratireductor sp. CAU 1489]|uniref:Transposase n=1 Tax=Nitratireductor arenosus TaxID=2682096 RepID=A0A844QDH6_9HYPH|nr:transposase [Nitratireductor arenosus]